MIELFPNRPTRGKIELPEQKPTWVIPVGAMNLEHRLNRLWNVAVALAVRGSWYVQQPSKPHIKNGTHRAYQSGFCHGYRGWKHDNNGYTMPKHRTAYTEGFEAGNSYALRLIEDKKDDPSSTLPRTQS